MPLLPYFAYGSNLSAAHWPDWCAARGLPPDALTPLCRAWLPDHRLALNYYSHTHRAGAANIMAAPGQRVPGHLFSISPAQLAALDAKESHPSTYTRTECLVLADTGEEVLALTYAVAPAMRRPFTPPTQTYRSRIEDGYRDRGLTSELPLLEQAVAGSDAPAGQPGLFVYGTLREGQRNAPFLERLGVVERQPAELSGRLWDFGRYPGVVFWPPAGEGESVVGERIQLSRPEEALAALDVLEGFPGWSVAGGKYRRTLVSLGSERVWAYQIQATDGGVRVVGGDWVRARGGRPPGR
ncbi:MAG: gamma-glutamylcyclotransferase (GGCT)/AIG2-like uncharacterized protein YtfP [Myxococcota bacterium]